MGKASRWLKSLFGNKKGKDINSQKCVENEKRSEKSFRKPYKNTPQTFRSLEQIIAEANVAVAAANLAVANMAEEGRKREIRNEIHWAAVKVQSVFRGFLARKALRALKGLVKIQALVRGYLVRKRVAATLHSMQALNRAQAAARCRRAHCSINKENRFSNEFRGRRSMERFDEFRGEFHSKRLSTSHENSISTFEEIPIVVEMDTKPKSRSRRMNASILDYGKDPYYQSNSSPLLCPFTSKITRPKSKIYDNYEWDLYGDEYKFATAQSTPCFPNAYKYNADQTPSRSVCGDSFFRPNSNSLNYMASTQSFSAKARSHSAPRERPRLFSKEKTPLGEIIASRNSLSGVKMQKSSYQVQKKIVSFESLL